MCFKMPYTDAKMKNFLKFKTRGSGSSQEKLRKLSEAYYHREATLWRPFRLFGLAAAFCGICLGVVSICNRCWLEGKDWQNAVIGLLIFSVAFGFLATILSICGVCSTPLPRKIYYYHSSGEIYFICALACTAALITYPLAIESDKIHLDHTYGYGYGLGWGSSFFFFASAICMTLDDIIKEMAKGVCCGGEKTNEMRV